MRICDWSSDVCSSDLRFGNDVRGRADTTGNALDIRDGAHVVSGGNRYQGGLEAAVEVNVTAGDGSRFVDDVFVDGGRQGARATVQIDGGVGHSFVDSSFVQRTDGGEAIVVRFGGDGITLSGSSLYAKSGYTLDLQTGKTVSGSGNDFYRADGAAAWVRLGDA